MKALVGAFNQEKALVGAFSVIVHPVVEPMEHYTALIWSVQERCCPPGGWCPAGPAPAETSGCRPADTDLHLTLSLPRYGCNLRTLNDKENSTIWVYPGYRTVKSHR